MQLYGKEIPPVKDPERIVGWLALHHPTLLNVLFLDDEHWSALIFEDTTPTTISWHIATMAAGGNVIAKMACEALNGLSQGHCEAALIAGY